MSKCYLPLSGLTTVILAGGEGMRLRPIIGEQQKVIAQVAGRPFLYYLLDKIEKTGITSVVLCISYQATMVKTLIGKQYGKIKLQYSIEPQPLGTAGALRYALPLMDSDPILVLNGDSICSADFSEFYQQYQKRKASVSLLLTQVDNTKRYGRVVMNQNGAIQYFEEKAESQGPGWISAGVYLLARATIAAVPTGRPVSIEKEIFPGLIGQDFYGHQTRSRFIDIGTPASFKKAISDLKT